MWGNVFEISGLVYQALNQTGLQENGIIFSMVNRKHLVVFQRGDNTITMTVMTQGNWTPLLKPIQIPNPYSGHSGSAYADP